MTDTALRRFEVIARDEPAVVLRLVGLCLRRGARIVALEASPEREALLRVRIAVSVDERHGRTLRARLAQLIDVLTASEAAAPSRSAASPA